MKKSRSIDTTYVGVLDGVRALGVLVVVWFHFWQQTWLRPVLKLPFTSWQMDLEWLPRSGYIMVDLLLVLSGFCLFLPIARQMVRGEVNAGQVDVRAFYRRRAVRILPSYYFCVLLILFAVVLPTWPYTNMAEFWRDLFANLTMTQTFFAKTFFFTKFNVVLWTVCIEMQFYLLFPLLARGFARRPVAFAALMTGISALGAALLLAGVGNLRFWLNQLPLLLCNYAAGMLGAVVFVRLAAIVGRKPAAAWGFSALAVGCIWGILRLARLQAAAQELQSSQLVLRFPLSILFGCLLVALPLAAGPLRVLFDNRVMRFLAGISFNLYIWHQYLAVLLKKLHLPAWSGKVPPNQTGDLQWQHRYALLIWAAAFAAALFGTYAIEHPFARLLRIRAKSPAQPCHPLFRRYLRDTCGK